MFDANVYDFEVDRAFYTQISGASRQKCDKLNLKSTYLVHFATQKPYPL